MADNAERGVALEPATGLAIASIGSRGLKFDSPEQEAYLQLWRSYDRLKMVEDALFGEYGLSAQQYNTLRLLEAAAPAGIPTLRIAERLVSRAPDITRLVDRLEERGWVVRHRRADNRRVVEVAISQAGIDLLAELQTKVAECHRKQLGHLDAAQLEQLVGLLVDARRPHEDPAGRWMGQRPNDDE